MKVNIVLSFLWLSLSANGQEFIDASKLTPTPHQPSIFGVNSENKISIGLLFEQGIKVVLADTSFKVIQFQVIYDCHSRSMFDFDSRIYRGDKVDPKDEYFRKRVIAGDAMDIINTIIEKNGWRYRMKDFYFLVTYD